MNESKTIKYWHFSQMVRGKFESSNPEPNLREIWRANGMGVYNEMWPGKWRNPVCTHLCQGILCRTWAPQHLGMLQFPWRFAHPVLADVDAAQSKSHPGCGLAKLQVPNNNLSCLSVWKEKYSGGRRMKIYTALAEIGCKEERTLLHNFTEKIYLMVGSSWLYCQLWKVQKYLSCSRYFEWDKIPKKMFQEVDFFKQEDVKM